MVLELESFVDVSLTMSQFTDQLNNFNQIFTRDVGFVIDKFFLNPMFYKNEEFQAIV